MPKPPPRPRRGGRPPLGPDRRRRHRLRLHLTASELATLRERAELTALPLACYVREAALGRPLSSRVNHEAIVQLVRAGNLLNQAVRYAHMTQRPADVEGAIVSAARAIDEAAGALGA
jgi:hypothetical protein